MDDRTFELDSWDWHDDSFKLDFHASEGISRSFWEEFAASENDALPFFESTPIIDITNPSATLDTVNSQESHGHMSSFQATEDSNISTKRRRMLLFVETKLDSSSSDEPSAAPFVKKFENSPHHETDAFLVADPVRATSWESTSYGGESCISEVDITKTAADSLTSLGRSRTNILPVETESGIQLSCMASPLACKMPRMIPMGWNKPEGSIDTVAPSLRKGSRSTGGISRKRKLGTCVAYPFALLKPSNIEGAVTLDDINQRILLPASKEKQQEGKTREEEEGEEARQNGTGFSGKSILALTKIHTEGKGSITIIRTKL